MQAVADREAVADLRSLYADRERLRQPSRQAHLPDYGRRAEALAVTERHIARVEAGMTPEELKEAQR